MYTLLAICSMYSQHHNNSYYQSIVSSNPTQAIQHYVIKFFSDLRQVGGLIPVLRFPPPIKLTATM